MMNVMNYQDYEVILNVFRAIEKEKFEERRGMPGWEFQCHRFKRKSKWCRIPGDISSYKGGDAGCQIQNFGSDI